MVALFIRPTVTVELTREEQDAVYFLLESWGALTADEVASALKLDETETELYLANAAGTGVIAYARGRYGILT